MKFREKTVDGVFVVSAESGAELNRAIMERLEELNANMEDLQYSTTLTENGAHPVHHALVMYVVEGANDNNVRIIHGFSRAIQELSRTQRPNDKTLIRLWDCNPNTTPADGIVNKYTVASVLRGRVYTVDCEQVNICRGVSNIMRSMPVEICTEDATYYLVQEKVDV